MIVQNKHWIEVYAVYLILLVVIINLKHLELNYNNEMNVKIVFELINLKSEEWKQGTILQFSYGRNVVIVLSYLHMIKEWPSVI